MPATPEPESFSTVLTPAPQQPSSPPASAPRQPTAGAVKRCMTARDAQLLVWVLDNGTRQIAAAAVAPARKDSRGVRLEAYDARFVCPFHASYLEGLCRSFRSDEWENLMRRYGFPSREVLLGRGDSTEKCGCHCIQASRLWGLLDHCLNAEKLGNDRSALDSDEEGFEETDKNLLGGYQYLAYAHRLAHTAVTMLQQSVVPVRVLRDYARQGEYFRIQRALRAQAIAAARNEWSATETSWNDALFSQIAPVMREEPTAQPSRATTFTALTFDNLRQLARSFVAFHDSVHAEFVNPGSSVCTVDAEMTFLEQITSRRGPIASTKAPAFSAAATAVTLASENPNGFECLASTRRVRGQSAEGPPDEPEGEMRGTGPNDATAAAALVPAPADSPRGTAAIGLEPEAPPTSPNAATAGDDAMIQQEWAAEL